MEVNGVASEPATKSTIHVHRPFQTLLSAGHSSRILFARLVKQEGCHEIDVIDFFLVESVSMGSSALGSGQFNCCGVLEIYSVVAGFSEFGIFEKEDFIVTWDCRFFIVAFDWQNAKYAHIYDSSTHQVHVGKGSDVQISSVITSEVLKIEVLLFH